MSEDPQEEYWQQVYNARVEYFESTFGPLPEDILKIGHMFGVWSGGGLFHFQAPKLNDLWVLTTFGFSNPDMPATTTAENVVLEQDEQGRPTRTEMRLVAKENPPATLEGGAGYGYELMILANEYDEWPLWLMQWCCEREIFDDVGFLGRVMEHNGLTVEGLRSGPESSENVLFALAQPPLPQGTDLPNGKMQLLIATTITDAEMQFSLENGREKLLEQLQASGVGQVSDPGRNSLI